MFISTTLSWPEITTLIASLGMVLNASVGLLNLKKSGGGQTLKPIPIPIRPDRRC